MNSFKATVCIIGGLLFVLSGCRAADISGRVQLVQEGYPATRLIVTPMPATATPVSTPTPSPTSTPSPTPAKPMPIPTPNGALYTYYSVAAGDTLSGIAWHYNITFEKLVEMNHLSGPDALIQTGQLLRVPLIVEQLAPHNILLPDSEVVYSPAYVGFDLVGFINNQDGYLATYRQVVGGEQLNGAETVERVARQFSVGPRLLLALLEYYGGWVTNPVPTAEQLRQPLGPRNPRGEDLYLALGFTANRINAGYYGYKRDGFWVFDLADGGQAVAPQGLNAGTVGLQNILAIHSDRGTWQQTLDADGFMATYRSLFGDPFAKAIEPLVPITLTQPSLVLPWSRGKGFYLTGNRHPAYVDGSAWGAIDVGPPDVLGHCAYSNTPVTAAASGVIIEARQGEVQLDLDGDGDIQTGWVLLYLHVALDAETPVRVGQQVALGDVIGYPSCEGGEANASHLHFARRYNGEWMDAGGPVPMNLSGWVVQPDPVPYEGLITNGVETRQPCECWDDKLNLIIHTAANLEKGE